MSRARVSALGVAVTLSLMVGLGDRPIAAQTARPLASMSVRRLSLTGRTLAGDFNGDGKIDLVSSSAPAGATSMIVVALGNGDGSFAAPASTGVRGSVLAVADFNHDGRLDLIADVTDATDMPLRYMAGRGDGTFAAPVQIGSAVALDMTFAIPADFDGDGKLDLAVGIIDEADDDGVLIYQGNGDGTFTDVVARLHTGTASAPLGGTVADINGDGTLDIVTANHSGESLTIALNHGAFTFTQTNMPLGREPNDVVAFDLNHDAKLDLVIAQASFDGGAQNGSVDVLFGNGDGTFRAGGSYPALGAWSVVVGDFNRDGLIDIASANRSALGMTDCLPPFKTWDSISIFSGNGDGTFAGANSLSIGNQKNVDDPRYRNVVSSLATSDVNGDGHPDLVVSDGVIFTNNAPDPNWGPSVTASATAPDASHTVILRSPASDADQDVLTYTWVDGGGASIASVPIFCYTPGTLGVHTFTVTVSDQHGHTASSSVTVDFGGSSSGPEPITMTAPAAGEIVPNGAPYTIRWTAPSTLNNTHLQFSFSPDNGTHWSFITECANTATTAGHCTWNNPSPDTTQALIHVATIEESAPAGSGTTGVFTIKSGPGGLPAPWQSEDVGAVGASGSATYVNGVFTVSGSGADIWGAADEFHYVSNFVNGASTGNFRMTTYVTGVQNVNAWTKAGLMVRTSLDPSATQASVFVTPGKGLAFQRRTADGGTSINTSVASITAPVWLRLVVNGYSVIALYKKNATDAWSVIGMQQFGTPPTSGFLFNYAGMAVTSHQDGTLAQATFSNVEIVPNSEAWSTRMIGATSGGTVTGQTSGALTPTARGSDIWGTSDQFLYAYTPAAGDGSVSANVRSVTNTNAWTKAGVMYRVSIDPGSPHVSLFVTPGKGIAMQYRLTANGTSTQVAQIAGVAPVYIRLRRIGTSFIGEWTTDLQTWHTVGQITVDALSGTVRGGVALTSHDPSASATAVFDDPEVRQ